METTLNSPEEQEFTENISSYSISETEVTTISEFLSTSLDDIPETEVTTVSVPPTGDYELLQSVKSIDYNLSVLTGLSIVMIVVLLCSVIIKTFFR